MARDWDERGRYMGGRYGYQGHRGNWRDDRERGWGERAGDEVRSWFGDDEAEMRRRGDERRHGAGGEMSSYRGRSYGPSYGGSYREYEERYPYDDRPGSFGGHRGDVTDHMGSLGPRTGNRYSYAALGMGLAGDRGYGDYGTRGYSGYGGRGYVDYSGRGYRSSDRGYGEDHERGFFDRAGDEVASWFGDEEAERRREMDAGHRGRGPKNYTRSDSRISEDVNDRLSDDPHIDASGIEVTVNDGEVTLDGTVGERFAKRHAEDLTERVSGVKHVQNNLRVNISQATTSTTGSTTSGTGTTRD